MLTRVLTAFAALGCLAAPGHAYVPQTEVLLLGGQFDTTVSTAPTDPSRVYVVSVSGVVSYEGRGTMLDCGHTDPPDERAWIKTSVPLLDGVSSPCSDVDANRAHSYCWVQRGTGAPLVFKLPATDTQDDVGGLVVTVDPHRRTCPAVTRPGL
jgi:hypothetical protein